MSLPWPDLTTEEWEDRLKAVAKPRHLSTYRSKLLMLGGEGSGNYGHAGRPGEVGGSAPDEGGAGGSTKDGGSSADGAVGKSTNKEAEAFAAKPDLPHREPLKTDERVKLKQYLHDERMKLIGPNPTEQDLKDLATVERAAEHYEHQKDPVLRKNQDVPETLDHFTVKGKTPDAYGLALTPERQELHDAVVRLMKKGTTAVQNPQVQVLGGGPASGKSSSGQADIENAVKIDVDAIRMFLPEYAQVSNGGNPGAAAAYTHEEASAIGKRLAKELGPDHNLIIDGTGDKSTKAMLEKVAEYRAQGQRVTARYSTNSVSEATRRAEVRSKTPPYRSVPKTIMTQTHRSVSQVLPDLLDKDTFDQVELWDTEQRPAVKVMSKEKGQPTIIHHQEKWNQFLAKGKVELSGLSYRGKLLFLLGSSTSGNFGHAGRPGLRGGSAITGMGGAVTEVKESSRPPGSAASDHASGSGRGGTHIDMSTVHATEVKQMRSDKGINGSYIVRTLKDGTPVTLLYKPESETVDVGYDGVRYHEGTPSDREVAAYSVDQALGFGLVPDTQLVHSMTSPSGADAGEGSAHAWVIGDKAAKAGHVAWDKVPQESWYEMGALDMLIANNDRHMGNFIIDEKGKLSAIDHGYSFATTQPYPLAVSKGGGARLPPSVPLPEPKAVGEDKTAWFRHDLEIHSQGREPQDAKIPEARRQALADKIRSTDWDKVLAPNLKGQTVKAFKRRAATVADAIERGQLGDLWSARVPGGPHFTQSPTPRPAAYQGQGRIQSSSPVRGPSSGGPTSLSFDLGDLPNHPFRGNQWKTVGGSIKARPGVPAQPGSVELKPRGAVAPPAKPAAPPAPPKPPAMKMSDVTPTSIKAIGSNEKGINESYVVKAKDPDGNSVKLQYKPDSGQRKLGFEGVDYHDGMPNAREVAAYKVDQALGFGIVPDTQMVGSSFAHGPGSAHTWSEGKVAVTASKKDWDKVSDRQWYQMGVLDLVIANRDRHTGNFVIGSDGKLSAIDHGYAFSTRQLEGGPARTPSGGVRRAGPSATGGLVQTRPFGSNMDVNSQARPPKDSAIPIAERKVLADRIRNTNWNHVVGTNITGNTVKALRQRAAHVADAIEKGTVRAMWENAGGHPGSPPPSRSKSSSKPPF